MTSNIKEFNRAIQAVGQATKKDGADIVNRALRNVAFRAMQFTESAEPGKIQAELYRDNIALKMAAAHLAKKVGTTKVDRLGNTKLTRGGRAQKHGRVTRQQIAAYATRIIKRAINSARAIKAGWIPAVKSTGGSVRSEKQKASGSASKGFAVKATLSRMKGEIVNALVTRDHGRKKTDVSRISQAQAGLNRAVAFVTQDMMNYAKSKIEARLRKHSDK